MSRLALSYELPVVLESFVLYVEKYAGIDDDGHYVIERLDGRTALSWEYTPVHLWREPAEPLLKIDKPGIIPLMALMKVQQPETTFPEMVKRLRQEPNRQRREGLLNALLALLDDEDYVLMIDKLIESDELLMDTPYLRRVRKQEKIEDILEVVTIRLNPPVKLFREIEAKLEHINDLEHLRLLFKTALTTDSIEEFTSVLLELPSGP